MLRRHRPLLDADDAARAGVAAIWAAGAWPTAAGLVQALRRAEEGYGQGLVDVRWPRAGVEVPKSLAAAVDRLVRNGELDVVAAPDGSEARLRPSRALVEDWLPLVRGREFRPLGHGSGPTSAPDWTSCLAAAGNDARGAPSTTIIADDRLVAEELRLRALHKRLVVDRSATPALPMFEHLEEEASLLAQTGQFALARRRWSELGNARLNSFDRPWQEGALGLRALEESVLSGDQGLQERVLSLPVSDEGLVGMGPPWQRVLRGLVLDEAASVDEGAEELDRIDLRRRRDSADVALGAAARAVVRGDGEALGTALERTVEQHLRYLRHGSWRGDASPVRAVMVLRLVAAGRGIFLPDDVFRRRVTVTLWCCDAWEGQPVHRHRATGTVDLAPLSGQ